MTTTLNLRKLEDAERRARLLDRFHELEHGCELLLHTDGRSPELLELLQRESPGGFDWHPLDTSDTGWEILLIKRRKGAPELRQVLEFMENDHRRIHNLQLSILAAVQQGEWDRCRSVFTTLSTSLRRHIALEEEFLFPVLASRFGSPRGPAVVLAEEHVEILALLDRLGEQCGDPERTAELITSVSDLVELLTHHSGKEDRILYALTDLVLDPEERDALVKSFQGY
ncbi:MAG: hemerythrin domain-containing protein [bacterium]